MIAEVLAEALGRVERALQRDDAVAAAAVLREVEAACRAATAEGPIPPARVAELRAVLARCEAAGREASARLARALSGASAARRASSAYGR